MANGLKNLLGVAPLENLRKKRNQDGFNLQENFFSNNQLNPIESSSSLLQPVSSGYYQNQMNNFGFQAPEDSNNDFGDDSFGGGFGDGANGAGQTQGVKKFYTDTSDLFSSFLGAMPGSDAKAQLMQFLTDSESGADLTLNEFGALMGFDMTEVEGNQELRDKLQIIYEGYGAGEQFAGLEDDLRNAQEYRTDLFGTTTQKAELEAASILGMAQQGSTSGLQSGRRKEAMQQGIQTLDSVLEKQLVDAESQYFGQIEGMFQSYVSDFQSDLKTERDKLLQENPEFADLIQYGTTNISDITVGNIAEYASRNDQNNIVFTQYASENQGFWEGYLQTYIDEFISNNQRSPYLYEIINWMDGQIEQGDNDN